jgi:DNA-binding transcriptional ArsR family regulator
MNGAISDGSDTAGFGTGAGRPATVVRFTADDLARVRFAAAPAPLVETALGFAELRHHARRPIPDSWASQARQAFPVAARPLRDLIPASGSWPEFLDPPVAELDEGLEIVSATPRSRLRDQLALSWRGPGRPSAWLRALADGDREALTTAVQALRAFYLACVAPAWPEIAASFRGDVTERAGVLASSGLGDLFGSLHPDLALRDGSLERAGRALARAGRPARLQLKGQGLQILPSMLWTGPPLFSINPPGPLPSIMIYPGRRDFRTGNGTRPSDLDAVLGRTRARVLRALRDTCSTTELAARVSISVSSASEHATALRAADLIRTERHGPRVRHSLTVLGRALLSGSPSRGAVPLKQRLRVRGALG